MGYYAPNTYKQLKIAQMRKDGITVSEEDAHAPYTLPVALLDIKEGQKYKTGPIDFLRRCMGPYLLIRFFLLPAPLLLISRSPTPSPTSTASSSSRPTTAATTCT